MHDGMPYDPIQGQVIESHSRGVDCQSHKGLNFLFLIVLYILLSVSLRCSIIFFVRLHPIVGFIGCFVNQINLC